MRSFPIFLTLTLVTGSTFAQKLNSQNPPITQFEIGRHTFFDVGPPFDFYEVFVVKANGSDSNVERIIITPEGDACFQPAKVETASGVIHKSVSDLLRSNPCAIPEKELKRELKRCKKCLVFSGANVAMRVQCANGPRIIRSDILDRDMFDPDPQTPARTSWMMRLVTKLDSALGPGVLEKPMFPTPEDQPTAPPSGQSADILELANGNYDSLFPGAPDRVSQLYAQSEQKRPQPTVELTNITPFRPNTFEPLKYPPIGRIAHLEGSVEFTTTIGSDGKAHEFKLVRGHPLLGQAVKNAAETWTFPAEAANQTVSGTVQFHLNCTASSAGTK